MALGLLSLTLLLIAGAVASRERDQWVNHTLTVLQNLEHYEASILAVQVQTGDPDVWSDVEAHRRSAEGSVTEAYGDISTILVLTADNPRQTVRIQVLKNLTDHAVARIRAWWSAPPMLSLPIKAAWTDLPIADTISEIRKEERALLEERRNARSSADTLFWIYTALALTVNLLIVWWAYLTSRRYMQECDRTELEIRELNVRLGDQVAAIRGLNTTLEDRVAEKTSELELTVAKLKSSNQELERFAYVASHDMQEPLRQVVSFNNLLALKYGEHLDVTANRYLENSVAGAKRLQLMLRGLLQYTVTSPAAVYRTEIPVDHVICGILRELNSEITEASAVVDVQAAEGLSIVGDREMIQTLVSSLTSNAIKFRQPDVPPRVRLVFERFPNRWTLVVSDNGLGIEERFIPKMFEMFARFHPVGQYQGAGVGLALSKKIVECHSGKLTVTSNGSAAGTSFSVEIPIWSTDSQNDLETGRFPY